MPKSKEYISDSESVSESGSGSDEEPKPKKKKVEKKEKKDLPKKEEKDAPKKEEKKSKDKAGGSAGEKGPNGEIMFQLAKMRYATVSEFRGRVMVSIREYYEKDGEVRPGKKGISLSVEQWNSLKDHIDDIDAAVKKL